MNCTSASSAPAAWSAVITRAHRWAKFSGPHKVTSSARREMPSARATGVATRSISRACAPCVPTRPLKTATPNCRRLCGTTRTEAGAQQQQPAGKHDSADPRRNRASFLNRDLELADSHVVTLIAIVEAAHQDEPAEAGDENSENETGFHGPVPQFPETRARAVRVTRMCVPAGRRMSLSLVATAYPAPAAAPTTAPMTVPLGFFPMTWPAIAPAAAPTPTFRASLPVTPRPTRSVARPSMLASNG